MSRIKQVIETLEVERAEVQQRLEWLDSQLNAFREHEAGQPGAPTARPSRSDRRATARRASARRSAARSVKRDTGAEIIAYLEKHPNSTAGEVAKGLNLNRDTVATRLSKMTKAGTITKAERGYAGRAAE